MLALDTKTFEREKADEYIIDNQTLIAEGASITVAGTSISFASSAFALSFDPTTIVQRAKSRILIFDNQVLVSDRADEYVLESQIIFPERAPITIKRTALFLTFSASESIIDFETLTARSVPSFPTIVIQQVSFQTDSASELVIAEQTLMADALLYRSINNQSRSPPANPKLWLARERRLHSMQI